MGLIWIGVALAYGSAEIEFVADRGALLYVDGRLARPSSANAAKVGGLEGGVHHVRVATLFGRTLDEARLEIPAEGTTRLILRDGDLSVAPAEGTAVAVVDSEGRAAVPEVEEAPADLPMVVEGEPPTPLAPQTARVLPTPAATPAPEAAQPMPSAATVGLPPTGRIVLAAGGRTVEVSEVEGDLVVQGEAGPPVRFTAVGPELGTLLVIQLEALGQVVHVDGRPLRTDANGAVSTAVTSGSHLVEVLGADGGVLRRGLVELGSGQRLHLDLRRGADADWRPL